MNRNELGEQLSRCAVEELNETPENVERGIAELRRLIAADGELRVPTDDAFLLRFLRARKFDAEKAFRLMQRYYLMRLRCPELFCAAGSADDERVLRLQAQCVLEKRDRHGRRVYIVRLDRLDASQASTEDVFRTNVLALEQMSREPETQIAGVIVIVDAAGLNLQHAKFLTPYYAKKMVQVVQETFPLRFKGFHVVNEPFYFDAFATALKPFLKEKIRKRIHLHGNEPGSLHAFVAPEILPVEYGGLAGPFDNTEWRRRLLDDHGCFVEQEKYGYRRTDAVDVDGEEDE